MASILIRNVDESAKSRLAQIAKERGTSMEAEARAIMHQALAPKNILDSLHHIMAESDGFPEFELPEREIDDRIVDFT